MIDQEKIHNQCLSENPNERGKALNQLKYNFSLFSDKQKAWDDLIILVNDNNRSIRYEALDALNSSFFHVPDKQQAWSNLHILITKKSWNSKIWAADILVSVFSQVPDKQEAWKDLHRLTNDKNTIVRFKAANAYSYVFSHIPEKQKAWNDLIKLTNDKDNDVRSKAILSLGSSFFYVPNKKQAWNNFHKLTSHERWEVRSKAAEALGYAFSQLPDKQQAWDDLHWLTDDNDINVRRKATDALFYSFPYIPDKQQAWKDIIKLSKDRGFYSEQNTAVNFSSIFYQVPEKQQAWNDLINLIKDRNIETYVKYRIVSSLGSVFPHIPDRKQAWDNLHELTTYKDKSVRLEIANTLGSVFSYVQDKQQVWEDLIKLTKDKDEDIRTYSSYSLGKVSIFKASQAEKEEEYKQELEKAISYFEEASFGLNNPSQFCLPFYRSFYSILFKKYSSKEEIDKFLAEANSAIKGSKRRGLLLGAVENLANALKEIQSLKNLDLDAKKSELNFYRKYCDRAAELMKEIEDVTPYATVVVRKGLPILNRNLKGLLEEIKEKAKIACKESIGTATQEIACDVNREVQKWEISDQEEMTQKVENLIFILKSKIPDLPKNEYIFKKIDFIKDEKDILRQYESLVLIIGSIPTIQVSSVHVTIESEQAMPTIGIITALPKEFTAVKILLDNQRTYKVDGKGAGRRYCLGEIPSTYGEKYNIVLSTVGMGNNIAASRASLLLEHFPNVESIIMVGIAGGVPDPRNADNHVRLGDIVVSSEKGVIQYDFTKEEINRIEYRYSPKPPSASLLEAVRYLEAEEIEGNFPWINYINQALSQLKITLPDEKKDHLYDFEKGKIPHPFDSKRKIGTPRVFTGPIASANKLLKNPILRDELRDKFKVKAIEMEASGIADATWNHEVGYLVVRGICDYCDSNKNDDWQQYAAVVAAAYTRALIESMP